MSYVVGKDQNQRIMWVTGTRCGQISAGCLGVAKSSPDLTNLLARAACIGEAGVEYCPNVDLLCWEVDASNNMLSNVQFPPDHVSTW